MKIQYIHLNIKTFKTHLEQLKIDSYHFTLVPFKANKLHRLKATYNIPSPHVLSCKGHLLICFNFPPATRSQLTSPLVSEKL